MKKGDYIKDLTGYIKKNLKKGYTKDSLKWALIKQGHSKLEVSKALAAVEEELAREAPVLQAKPEIHYEVVSPDNVQVEKKSFWKRLFGG